MATCLVVGDRRPSSLNSERSRCSASVNVDYGFRVVSSCEHRVMAPPLQRAPNMQMTKLETIDLGSLELVTGGRSGGETIGASLGAIQGAVWGATYGAAGGPAGIVLGGVGGALVGGAVGIAATPF